MNTSALHTLWGQRPNMTHFDYSVLKQQVTGLPRMSSVSLASVQRQHSGPRESWLATCPIYKWAVLSLTSSKPKMSCLHLVRVQSPFQDGSSSLSLERGCADKCSGSYGTFSGECLENNPGDAGVLNNGCFIGDHEAINCPSMCVLSYNTRFCMYEKESIKGWSVRRCASLGWFLSVRLVRGTCCVWVLHGLVFRLQSIWWTALKAAAAPSSDPNSWQTDFTPEDGGERLKRERVWRRTNNRIKK